MSFLHNQILTIGDRDPVHINLPDYHDIILQVLPECIEAEDTSQTLAYKSANVDFGTGSTARFLLKPRAVATGELAVKSFTRKQYNTLLDFTFLSEGRYLSFWGSDMTRAFSPICHMDSMTPELMSTDVLFGPDADTGERRQWFYALNWGQRTLYQESKKSLLAIYTSGFKKCFWTRCTRVDKTYDPRVIKVNVAHLLPEIPLHDIDLVTEYTYMRRSSDEAPFEFITNEIVDAPFTYEEDEAHAYDPWGEMPKIYPVFTAEEP